MRSLLMTTKKTDKTDGFDEKHIKDSRNGGSEIHGNFNKLESLLLYSSALITVNQAIDLLSAQLKITPNICFV